MFLPGILRNVIIAAAIVDIGINMPSMENVSSDFGRRNPANSVTITINKNDVVAKNSGPVSNQDFNVFLFIFYPPRNLVSIYVVILSQFVPMTKLLY